MALAVQIFFGMSALLFLAATIYGVVMLNKVRTAQKRDNANEPRP